MRTPKISSPASGAKLFDVREGVINSYGYGRDLGTVAIEGALHPFRRHNLHGTMDPVVGAKVRCWILPTGFIQALAPAA